MPEERQMTSGALERPMFGVMPEGHVGGRRRKTPFPYKRLIGIVREHPGQAACIAKFPGGPNLTKKRTLAQATYARDRTNRWLEENFPLENWQVSTRTTAGSWCDRELWVQLLGTFETEQEALQFRKERAAKWREGRGAGLRRHADRVARDNMALIQSARSRHP